MSRMGRYCKAYMVPRFREFRAWTENSQNLKRANDSEKTDASRQLTDSDFLYLQENFTVTDDVFIDENVIFDNVTPEWIEFCKNQLGFEIPPYAAQKSEQE
jgi:hypothetical protein